MPNYDKNLIFRKATLRNFLSFGNQEQEIILDGDLVSVILGENLDAGGDDSRNGAGKSAIIDSLCYALFGKTLRETSNQLLINDLVARGHAMYVRLEFDKGEYSYLVERGEKPSKLLLLKKPRDSKEDFYARKDRKLKFDISRPKKADTTIEITNLLGYNLPLFSFLVANSSESTPFFKMPEDKRREVTESLFGFTILSERAERLKKKRKKEKENLIRVETAYSTEIAANKRVESEIEEMERRSAAWESAQENTVAELEETVSLLKDVDFDKEIETLNQMADLRSKLKDLDAKLSDLQHQYTAIEKDRVQAEKNIERSEETIAETKEKLKDLGENRCPTCKQHWEADPEYRGHLEEVIETESGEITEQQEEMGVYAGNLEEVEEKYGALEVAQTEQQEQLDKLASIEMTFETPEQAAEAGASLKAIGDQLEAAKVEQNPHTESIDGLRKKAVTEVDDTDMKNLRKLVHHFNFMIELLTSKDSFIRRNIIDQWLPKLNEHIAFYLDILELPHTVEFQADLTVKITRYHNEKQWGNLSKGERGRLIIALNFAFQDIFEYMNYRINLLCVDELLDNGMCPRGAERSVDLIKTMGAESHKRILLITHRDDIAARVDHMMVVRKENDLSHIFEVE